MGCARPGVLLQEVSDRGWRLSSPTLFPIVEKRHATRTIARSSPGFDIPGVGPAWNLDPGDPDKSDFIPIALSQIPKLIRNHRISIDVALIQTSLPDAHGFVSLGISVDITRTVVQRAKKVIAEINTRMPRTCGETLLPVEKIDQLVLTETPLIEYSPGVPDAVSERISRHTARLICSGSTLRAGPGPIPWEVLRNLCNRRDLRVHTDAVIDPVADLLENGVISASPGTQDPARIVAGACMGTRRLYELVNDNPVFSFHPIEYVCDPSVLSKIPGLVSITEACCVDLSGQVYVNPPKGSCPFGCLTEPEFLRGAALSPGGKPIMCLPSTADGDRVSRIRPFLAPGEDVVVPHSDVHYVVTEFGTAYLFGASLQERVRSLIRIAHPSFRAWLEEEAERLGILKKTRASVPGRTVPRRDREERLLNNGERIRIRPARPGDVKMLRDLFRRASSRDLSTRYFTNLQSLDVNTAEHLGAHHPEGEEVLVGLARSSGKQIIAGCICYCQDPTTNLADMACLVHPEWRGKGLCTELLRSMIQHARNRGLKGFSGDVPRESTWTFRTLEKSGCSLTTKARGRNSEITLLL